MDSFFGGSKSSLHETVKAQQDRLAKYEKKLGDLVKAYKILQEEKKALQDTVNAFSAHPPETCESNTSEGEDSGQENNLRQQVSALTKTLTSLNETKNTLESRFQHDKKELLDQIENLKNSLSAEQTVSQRERADHEVQLKEMKCKLRNEQHEREQEQTHHVAMLRELQHMLDISAAERNSNQKLELELDDTRSSQNFEKQRSLFEEKIRLLNDEKSYLSKELEKTRIKLNQPSRDFLLLEKEVVELRAARVELETLKNERENSAYQQLHLQSSADQTRIRDLENRLTDLSELIADYDATQKRDQEEIARLQKRVSSLESESSTEKRRSVSVSVNTNIVVSDLPTSPTTPTTPTSPTSYTTDIRPAPLQLVTKNREAEISKLRNDMTSFKLEIRKLQDEKKQQQLNLVSLTEQHKFQLSEIAEQHTREMAELDKGQSTRLNELLDSSTKARLRSQELIAERDEEIAELKKQIHAKERPAAKDGNLMGELLSNVETENVPRTLIFYKQQHKFLSEELTKLKQTRETLEQSLREKERNEHVNMREWTKLKQETTRLIRNTTRESANLEYLKNIVLRYLRATSSSEKRQILLAIFTVLEFSDDERSSVKHKLVPGWFS